MHVVYPNHLFTACVCLFVAYFCYVDDPLVKHLIACLCQVDDLLTNRLMRMNDHMRSGRTFHRCKDFGFGRMLTSDIADRIEGGTSYTPDQSHHALDVVFKCLSSSQQARNSICPVEA